MKQFFASKRNILNLIAVIIGMAQYLADTEFIDPKIGALIVFSLNMVLGTFWPTGPVGSKA